MNREEREGEMERLHPSSYAWALGCCRRDGEEAEDVLQESYLKILDGKARFAGGSSFRTFLFGVIRQTAAAAPAGVEGRETQLSETLAALAARQREVLELVFGHGMTMEEAARTLGLGRLHETVAPCDRFVRAERGQLDTARQAIGTVAADLATRRQRIAEL